MSILRVFTIFTVFLNFLLGVLGLFGYIWRPIFRNGSTAAPYWLVRLYTWLPPRGTAILLGLFILFFMLSFLGRFTMKDSGAGFNPLLSALRFGLIIAVISTIPSFLVKHTHISSENYNSGNYNLMRESSFGSTNLLLVHCSDPGQLSCRPISRLDNYPLPDAPTPMPTRVVVVEGIEVILQPNYIPTPIPPVEFGIEAASGDLAVRIGQNWNLVATPEATVTGESN